MDEDLAIIFRIFYDLSLGKKISHLRKEIDPVYNSLIFTQY